MEYLTAEDLVDLAVKATGTQALVRDYGLLGSAAHRPMEYVFGHEVYPTVHQKAAALMESIVRYHPLVDGNKRLAWTAMRVFYGLNGYAFKGPSKREAIDFVISIAVDHPEIAKIANRLETWAQPPS